MEKKHKLAAVVLGIATVCTIGIIATQYSSKEEYVSLQGSALSSPTDRVVIAGDKEYVVGADGFEPGYYDVSTKEPVKTNAFNLGVNQTILNIRYYNHNKISLSQGSSVIMTRSKFEPLKFHDDIAVLNNTTGAFRCGEEIEAGTYKVSVEGKHKNAEIFFQVEMNTENKWEAVDNVQVKNKKSAILKIQGNEYLNIVNFYPEYGDFKIYIKKVE